MGVVAGGTVDEDGEDGELFPQPCSAKDWARMAADRIILFMACFRIGKSEYQLVHCIARSKNHW